MSIYDKISKMLGSESDEEKLYKVLNTDEYKERPYEYKDLGEGMAVIGETMWGWWKHRFLINHNTKRAYEFMDKELDIAFVLNPGDDIIMIGYWIKESSENKWHESYTFERRSEIKNKLVSSDFIQSMTDRFEEKVIEFLRD